MRILLASSSSGSRGGGELFLLYLGEALVRRGHTLGLWVSSHERMDELAERFQSIGDVCRAKYRNTYDYPTRLVATCLNAHQSQDVAGQWRTWQPDVVHVNKQNLEDGLDLLRAARESGLASICTVHITQSARFLKARVAWLRDYLSRRALLKYPGPLVAVHRTRQKELQAFLGADGNKVVTVPNGVQIPQRSLVIALRPRKRAELGLAEGQRLVLSVGRMVPQKRPSLFLSLAEQIHAQLPNTQFLWVGDGGWSAEWDRMVSERNLGGFVKRLPWQPEPLPFIAAADLLLHTAEFEGLPFSLIEAMASGLACGVSTQLAQELSLQDADSVVLVEDVQEVIKLLKDEPRLQTLGERGLELARQQFSLEYMAKEYEELYCQASSLSHAH